VKRPSDVTSQSVARQRGLGLGRTMILVAAAVPLLGMVVFALWLTRGSSAVVPAAHGLLLAVAGAVLSVGLVLLVGRALRHYIAAPLDRVAEGLEALGNGDLARRVDLAESTDPAGVAAAFNVMAAGVGDQVSDLEVRVARGAAALDRRNAQLRAVALVVRQAAGQRNVNALLDSAVSAVTTNFGFYHTGIFILDDVGEWAILRAASSEGGRRMLNRGHRLQVGQVGIVGYVAATGQPRVAYNVGEDAVWFSNPDLPDTHAEMALPLTGGDRVIGVLDVQSEDVAAFTDEDIDTLQLMADQITIALDNARSLQYLESTLDELRELQVDYARSGWARVAQRIRPLAYEYDQVTTIPVPPLPVPEDLAGGKVPYKIVMDGGSPVVMEALRVGDQTLGYLGLSDPERAWSDAELELVASVGEQVALALDNARLFEDTQRNERQQVLISRVLQVASDPELDASRVLDEIAQILAQGLGVTVAIFTFPYTQLPVVRAHAVVDPEGRTLPLFDEDLTLAQEHYIFFQGLTTPELGPMTPLLRNLGGNPQVEALMRSHDFDRVLYVPIASAGVRTGFIGLVQDLESPPLDPDTRELAQNLASQIAVVLENLNLTEETRQRSEELRQLYRISLAVSGQLEPGEVLALVVRQGAELLEADAANLWVVDGGADRLRLAHQYGESASGEIGREIDGSVGLAGAALTQRETLYVEDYATWEGQVDGLVDPRYRGGLAVPLVGRFGPLGVLEVMSEQVGAFSERESGLADLFSAQAATALENAQLNQEAQQRAEEFSQLYDAGIDLITILDVEELLDRAADWARRIFGAERVVVFLREEQASQGPAAGHFARGLSVSDDRYRSTHNGSQPSGGGLTEQIIADRKSILIRDNRASLVASAERMVEVGLLSQMGAPLRVGTDVLGAVFVNGAAVGQFAERDVTMLEFLAAQISSALQNSIQFGQTEQALAVVGQQARYQENVSHAVALLNERGAEATQVVLHLLGDASEVPVVLYFGAGSRGRDEVWRLEGSWLGEGRSLERLRDAQSLELRTTDLPMWLEGLIERGFVMATRDELSGAEQAVLSEYEFGAALALAVSGEAGTPGFIGLFRDRDEVWSEQEVVALQTVAAALSNTLARERLFNQVQETLSETEALYRGGAALSEARTYNDILQVFLEHTVLGDGSQTATMQLFDHAWAGGRLPEYAQIMAHWSEHPPASIRRRYLVEKFPVAMRVMENGAPAFVEDLDADNPLDRRIRALFRRTAEARGLVIMPLVVGGQRIGFLHADYSEPHTFTEAAQRRLETLAQQAAIAVLNIRQLQETEARVRREQLIRQITARIQESPDVEGVLQTAVQELGRAFGTSRSRIQFRPTSRDEASGKPIKPGSPEVTGG